MSDVQAGFGRPDGRRVLPARTGLIGELGAVLESAWFQRVIIALIVLNAVTIGLETSPTAVEAAGWLLTEIDRICLAVFVAELAAKLVVYRARFLRDPWNVFDAVVIGLALLPTSGGLAVLRALRVLRVLRLISAVPSMRRVVAALLHAVPGMGSVVALLALLFYVFSVMATKLFGGAFPEWFGTVGGSAYTLFQVMTLESWSMGIVRPVMEAFPFAWAFFLPFILITSFAVLNLFIGIIVDAMQTQSGAQAAPSDAAPETGTGADMSDLLAEVRALRRELAVVRASASGERPEAGVRE